MTSTAPVSTIAVSMNAEVHGLVVEKGDVTLAKLAKNARLINKGRGIARVIDADVPTAKLLITILNAESRRLLDPVDGKIAPADRRLAKFAKQVADRIPAQIEKAAAKATAPAKQPATVEAAAAKAKSEPAPAEPAPVSDQLLENFEKAGLPVKRAAAPKKPKAAKKAVDPAKSAAAKKAAATRAAKRAAAKEAAKPQVDAAVKRVLTGKTDVTQEIARILA